MHKVRKLSNPHIVYIILASIKECVFLPGMTMQVNVI